MASSSNERALTSSLPSFNSSSSSSAWKWKYDVFLSFRGKDTRLNFVDHLHKTLKGKGLCVYIDEEVLDRGKEISPELLKAIEESRFSIIIFSENYADSGWCLDELVKIIECTEKKGQIALPVFYNMDPSIVRKQSESYGRGFVKHEKGLMENLEKVQRWRAALTHAANLSGWDTRGRYETDIIQEIVEKIFNKSCNALPHINDGLVGIDSHMEKMHSMLSTHSNNVKFLGIHGLGGIGKTTIAQAVYDHISNQFEGCSYLANVRKSSKSDGGLVSLQEHLLRDILNLRDLNISNVEKGSSMIMKRLGNKKVLVILDDVDDIDQLKHLAGKHDWFGLGSRIIITTRDQGLLKSHGVDERYELRALDREKSLEIFSWKAFKQYCPTKDFKERSNIVVDYAKGLPLALKVLGSYLYGRNKIEWDSTLDKLKKVPEEETCDILKISYDGLKQTEKKIFLDIACLFNGYDKDYVTRILNSCNFFTGIGINVLIEKSLITISNNNELLMHDLVQDMGRNIVIQESPDDPCKRSRLWLYEEIRHVLTSKHADTKVVEAIMLKNEYDFAGINLSAEAFVNMHKLRLLCMKFPQGLNSLLDNFHTLVFSPIKQLWDGIKVLQNLTTIDLSMSKDLLEIPDLTRAPNLENLILDRCENLSKIDTSVMLLKRLKYLSLNRCRNLKKLPHRIEMESLQYLGLSETAIEELPSSIGNITGLKSLKLSKCENLMSLPNNICKLKYLEILSLGGCSNILKLPEELGNLECLEKLDASRTAISEVPPSIARMKNLQWLSFSHCSGSIMLPTGPLVISNGCVEDLLDSSLEISLPAIKPIFDTLCFKFPSLSSLCSVTYLDLSYLHLSDGAITDDLACLSSLITLDISGNDFVSISANLSQLPSLAIFRLNKCKKIQALPVLPSCILDANDCISLERVSTPSILSKRKFWSCKFLSCFKLEKSESNLADAAQQFQRQALFGNAEAFTIWYPGKGIPGWFSHQNNGCTVDIPLSFDWNNKKLQGLAFCVNATVIDMYGDGILGDLHFIFEYVSKGGEMVCLMDSAFLEDSLFHSDFRVYCEYVLVMGYVSCARFNTIPDCLDSHSLTKASFRCDVPFAQRRECGIGRVNECGICLVYDDDVVDDGYPPLCVF